MSALALHWKWKWASPVETRETSQVSGCHRIKLRGLYFKTNRYGYLTALKSNT